MSRKEEGNGYHRRLLVEARRDLLNSQMLVATGSARFPLAVPDGTADGLCGHCVFFDRCRVDVFALPYRTLPCEVASPAHRQFLKQSKVLGRFETRA